MLVLLLLYIGLPEEVRRSDNHVLEVLQRQPTVVIQVSFIQHLLTHHPHLVLRQLVSGLPVQGLLQVRSADEVVVVEILSEVKQSELVIHSLTHLCMKADTLSQHNSFGLGDVSQSELKLL